MTASVFLYIQVTVATTLVLLEGRKKVCRAEECNLGNLITDAIVSMTRQFGYGDQWASVTLGFWNGGGIRNTIEKKCNRCVFVLTLPV